MPKNESKKHRNRYEKRVKPFFDIQPTFHSLLRYFERVWGVRDKEKVKNDIEDNIFTLKKSKCSKTYLIEWTHYNYILGTNLALVTILEKHMKLKYDYKWTNHNQAIQCVKQELGIKKPKKEQKSNVVFKGNVERIQSNIVFK